MYGYSLTGFSKIHLSSALKVLPTPEACNEMKKFSDAVYLHQVVERDGTGARNIYRDLPDALKTRSATTPMESSKEWRIHFHVPLHAPAAPPFENTNDHLLGILDQLQMNPKICTHLEMETYTWEVLPPELKTQSVVDQLAQEYHWTLARLKERRLV